MYVYNIKLKAINCFTSFLAENDKQAINLVQHTICRSTKYELYKNYKFLTTVKKD